MSEQFDRHDDTILEVIGVTMTVLTALVAFLAVRADDKSADLDIEAQRALSEADVQEARADSQVVEQLRVYDEWVVAEPGSFAREYYESALDPLLWEDVIGTPVGVIPDDPFDDEFYDEVYADADIAFDEANALFDEAAVEGNRALEYQAALLTFAVGLSFAAWGSLAASRTRQRTRRMFTILALVALAIGGVQLLTV